MWKKILSVLVCAVLLFGTTGFTGAASQNPKSDNVHLQLIQDQDTVSAGGKLSYHVIVHNVENKNRENNTIHVNIHEDLEVVDSGFGEWDPELRMLRWHVKDIKAKGAEVFHFQVKVKQHVKKGKEYELEAGIDLEGNIKRKTPKVKLKIGKQTLIRSGNHGDFIRELEILHKQRIPDLHLADVEFQIDRQMFRKSFYLDE